MTELKSVLIVEDEAMIAMDLEMSLADMGWRVVGPTAHVDQALRLLEAESVGVGLLDFSLVNETTEPVALALIEKDIPVIFLSGDGVARRPQALSHCQVLSKPVDITRVNDALLAALK